MEKENVSWKRFFAILAGNTNGAHCCLIKMLKGIGQTEASSPEQCDYLLVFCPVVSRVGTDIPEALNIIPCGKPVILVLMHHTSDPDYVVAESQRQVKNPNVWLTVSCLFYEGKLLNCSLNDIMWIDTGMFLGVPISRLIQTWPKCECWDGPLILGLGLIMFIMMAATVAMEVVRRMI